MFSAAFSKYPYPQKSCSAKWQQHPTRMWYVSRQIWYFDIKRELHTCVLSDSHINNVNRDLSLCTLKRDGCCIILKHSILIRLLSAGFAVRCTGTLFIEGLHCFLGHLHCFLGHLRHLSAQ